MTIEPFAWKDRPSLIESVLPAQKISAEAQKERKAGAARPLPHLAATGRAKASHPGQGVRARSVAASHERPRR